MPKKKGDKLRWKEIPLWARAATVIGVGTGLGYAIIKSTQEPDPRKVKYDKDNTGWIYNWSTGEAEHHPNWTPNALAGEVHTVMSGINAPMYGSTARSQAWFKLAAIDEESKKWLHNYWIDEIDPEESLYSWINSQVVFYGSEEEEIRDFLLSQLIAADLKITY